jgi:hypothetical protein
MPTESMIVTIAVLAVFAGFGSLLLFADLTWDRAADRVRARR